MLSWKCLIMLLAFATEVIGDVRPAVRACVEFGQIVRESSSEFPFIVAITSHSRTEEDKHGRNVVCMGTLIDKKFVLTLGQCAPKAKFVLLGAASLSDTSVENIVEVSVKSAHVHPEFSSDKYKYNIAVLELEHEITYSKYIFPTCLFDDSVKLTDEMEFISFDRRNLASNVEKYKVKIEPLNTCNATYVKIGQANWVSDANICALSPENEDDDVEVGLCHAFAGAPLVHTVNVEKQFYHQVGFIMVGPVTCSTIIPDILMRIPYHLEFIENIVWPKVV